MWASRIGFTGSSGVGVGVSVGCGGSVSSGGIVSSGGGVSSKKGVSVSVGVGDGVAEGVATGVSPGASLRITLICKMNVSIPKRRRTYSSLLSGVHIGRKRKSTPR